MPRSCRFAALALCLLLSQASLYSQERPARPPLTPQLIAEALRTDWYGVYFQDKKIGYAKSSLARVDGPGGTSYVSSEHMKISVVSAGARLELRNEERLEFEAQPPYRLRRATSIQAQGNVSQEMNLVRTAKGFTITTTTRGDKDTKQIAALDYNLADALGAFAWLRGRPAVGTIFGGQDLDLNELKLEQEERKLLAIRTALVKGVQLTYYEVEATQPRHGLTTLERYDDKGILLSGRLGESFEMRLETEEQAQDFKAGADVFVLGLVKIDRPVGDARKVSSLVVEVAGKDTAGLESGPCQSVTRNPAGGCLLKLGKAHGKAVRATVEEIKDSLAATVNYPAANPRILALAKKAVGDARSDREKVERLVRFVHGFIRPSYRNKGTIVLDLLDRKEGDCTAYAALFTTLARAAGVPSRELSGFLYVGDSQKAFGGHAWNEVVLDGSWVPVDASCGETEVNATHISLGSDVRGGVNLLRNFGTLSLRLVDVQHSD